MSEAKCIFTWTVENYGSYFFESKESLISPEFTLKSSDDEEKSTNWKVLFLNSGDRSKRVSCALERSKTCTKPEKLEISYNVELMGSLHKLYSSKRTVTKEFAKGDRALIISDECINQKIVNDSKSPGDNVTIRLELLSKNLKGNKDAECIARTKVGGDLYSFEWNLGETSFPKLKTFSCIQGMQVALEVCSEPDDSVKVVVKRTTKKSKSRFLQFKLSFVDAYGTKMGCKKFFKWFPSKETELEFSAPLKDNCFESNKNVTLLCDCHVSNETVVSELKYIQNDVSAPESSVHPLQEEFQRMYLNKILSDVKLRAGDEIFFANKCVLSSRSPLFQAMFTEDIKEKEMNFIDIPDIKPKIFAMFLEFVYTGKTNLCNYEDALKLLLCAKEYEVLPLKEYCSSFLMQFLCEKNACEILIIADKTDMKLLKSSAIRRILAHALRIVKSVDWIKILEHHPKLATEVLSIMLLEHCF